MATPAKKNKDKKKLAVYKNFGNVNDYTFQKWWKLKGNEFFHVKSWKDTRELLYSIKTNGTI